jgi:hypothetical protein
VKAEFYWGLRMRFEHGTVGGLEDERAIGQLAGIRYKHNARGQIEIESKAEARKRGVKSPDRAEAVMLAFARPATVQMLFLDPLPPQSSGAAARAGGYTAQLREGLRDLIGESVEEDEPLTCATCSWFDRIRGRCALRSLRSNRRSWPATPTTQTSTEADLREGTLVVQGGRGDRSSWRAARSWAPCPRPHGRDQLRGRDVRDVAARRRERGVPELGLDEVHWMAPPTPTPRHACGGAPGHGRASRCPRGARAAANPPGEVTKPRDAWRPLLPARHGAWPPDLAALQRGFRPAR